MPTITREHLIGFAAGVGTSAVVYYLYKKNQSQVDSFLASHKVIGTNESENDESLSLQDLLLKKERIEDLIAEKELISKGEIVHSESK